MKGTKYQTKTFELLQVSFHLVNRIMHLTVQRGLSRRKPQKISALSIDEKSFKRRHEYVTILSDPGTGVVLDVGEVRSQ